MTPLNITKSQWVRNKLSICSTDFVVNSSPPSATYVCQCIRSAWLVTYSAPSHFLNQWWVIANWNLANKLQWNFKQNTKLFIHENAPEKIFCEMVAILSRGRWVKAVHISWTTSCLICHLWGPVSLWSDLALEISPECTEWPLGCVTNIPYWT